VATVARPFAVIARCIAWLPVIVTAGGGAPLRRGLHGDEPLFWDRRARRGQPMPGPKGVRMPGFFGYCGWAVAFLIPVFILATFVFFR
jgi:hypothetical protein